MPGNPFVDLRRRNKDFMLRLCDKYRTNLGEIDKKKVLAYFCAETGIKLITASGMFDEIMLLEEIHQEDLLREDKEKEKEKKEIKKRVGRPKKETSKTNNLLEPVIKDASR